MAYDYSDRVFSSIATAPVDDWTAVSSENSGGDAAGPFLDLRFLRALESTAGPGTQYWPLVIYDEHNRPAACACLTLFRVDGAILAGDWGKRPTAAIRRLFPNYLFFNVLLCGSAVSEGQSGLRLRPDANPAKVAEALDRVLCRVAAEHGARVVVAKEFDPASCQRLAALGERGYLRVDSLPVNLLSPRFASFDDVIDAMKSHYRAHLTKSLRKFRTAGLRIETITEAERIRQVYTPHVHRLYQAVECRAAHRFEPLSHSFFHELTRQFPSQISLTVAWRGGDAAGFAWGLLDQGVFCGLFVGLDYTLNAEADLYFNLIMHDLDYGLRQHPSAIIVGQSADQFKSRLGCHQESRYFFVKARGRLLKHCLRLFQPLMFPPSPPPRSQRELFRVGQISGGKNAEMS